MWNGNWCIRKSINYLSIMCYTDILSGWEASLVKAEQLYEVYGYSLVGSEWY
jgi:hypothetical protein